MKTAAKLFVDDDFFLGLKQKKTQKIESNLFECLND